MYNKVISFYINYTIPSLNYSVSTLNIEINGSG